MATVREAWSKYDDDGEGYVNVKDLAALVAELGAGKLSAAALAAAEGAMAPREGVIAREDFVAWWAGAGLVPGAEIYGAAAAAVDPSGGGGDGDDEGVAVEDEDDRGNGGGESECEGEDAVEARFRRAAAAEKLRARQRAAGDIFAAAWNGDLAVVTAFLHDDPSLAAAEDCFPEEADSFRKAEWQGMWEGEPPLGEYNTPLHYAAQQGHVQVMAALLGATVTVTTEPDSDDGDGGSGVTYTQPALASVDVLNFAGVTPLFLAAQQGQVEAVRWLLHPPSVPCCGEVNGSSPPQMRSINPADATLRDPEHSLSALDVADEAVRAVFRGKEGQAWGAPGKLRAAPSLEQPRATSLLACWGAPPGQASDGSKPRLPLSGYKVKLSPAETEGGGGASTIPNAPTVVLLAPAMAFSLRVEGLAPGVEYVARVAAANIAGAAPYSEPSAALGTGAAPPSLRGVLSVATVASRSVTLKWQFSRVTGMAAIERFVLERQEGGVEAEWEVAQHPAKEEREFVVEALTPLTKYRFRLAAENRAGVGRFCAPVTIATTREGETPDDGSDDEVCVCACGGAAGARVLLLAGALCASLCAVAAAAAAVPCKFMLLTLLYHCSFATADNCIRASTQRCFKLCGRADNGFGRVRIRARWLARVQHGQ